MAGAKRLRVDVVALIKQMDIIIKMLVNTQITSKYRSVYKGKGLEFEDYRVYAQGDDASRIDWKASIRANDLLIKLFREERNLDVYILLDTSSSMIFGSTEKLKLEYAAEVAAAFMYFIIEAGDKAGLIMFNDKIVRMIPPKMGKKNFYIMLSSLVNAEFYGGGRDITKAVEFVMKTSKERGLMIIISDFIGMKGDWEHVLRMASVKFDVIGVMIRDPRDEVMPDEDVGQFVVSDPFSNEELVITPKKIGTDYMNHVQREEETIKKTFIENNLDLVKLSTARPFVKDVAELFVKRGKSKWR